jgi:LuxR family maltose regulon positive regulatory protein
MRLSQADGALYIQLIAADFLADMQVFQGHLGRAIEMYRQVLAWAGHGIPQKGVLLAHAGLANVLCEQDQLDAALAHVQSGIEQLEQVGGPGAALWLYRTLARVQQAKGNWTDALDALDRAYQSGQSAQMPFVTAQAGALRATLQLAQGDLGAAALWVANSGLSPDDKNANHPGVREVEYLSFARVLNAHGRDAEAMSLLERLLDSAQTEERGGNAIGILVLQCLVIQAQGDTARALEHLERALNIAEPEGYIRTFVDEGEPMRLLLLDYQSMIKMKISDGVDSQSLHLLTYTDKLLAAFSPSAPVEKQKHETILEPISEREMDILRLIATGRTNQEIAVILVLAQSTVKWYINNLYSKLGAKSRTHALALAREFELI